MEATCYSWEDDPVSAPLIEKMQLSGAVELDAKEYLRPIFKWTKQGNKSYNIDRANSFAEYLVTISRFGDPVRHIIQNRSIQAKYAFNILITMAQRRGSSTDAWLSYLRILEHGFEPDVFTMTALIDVIGRSDDARQGISRALMIFDKMSNSRNYLPNVITFVTMFRALGKANLHEIDTVATSTIILGLLKCAHTISIDDSSSLPSRPEKINSFGAIVDITIYNAALSACTWLKYPATSKEILLEMRRRGSNLNSISHKIISKLAAPYNRIVNGLSQQDGIVSEGLGFPENELLQNFVSVGALMLEEVALIKIFFSDNSAVKNSAGDDIKTSVGVAHSIGQYAGCLGPDATEELRQCVIHHDLRKLIERPEGFSESDFATLIHQCRKRKWQNQVDSILQFMIQRVSPTEEPSSSFNPSPSFPSTSHPWLSAESSNNLRRCIVPLTWTIFEAAFDAYFCMDMGDDAFALHKYLLMDDTVSAVAKKSLLQQENVWFVLKGFFKCGRADCAVLAYDSTCSLPTRQLVMGLMHGLGRGDSVSVAIRILSNLFKDCCIVADGKLSSTKIVDDSDLQTELCYETPPFSLQTCKTFMVTLLESCAVLGNRQGMETILSASLPLVSADAPAAPSERIMIWHLLNELIVTQDSDFIAVCLMCCASEGQVSVAHDMLMAWQSPPLQYLPPHIFLHGLLAESFALTALSTSQASATSTIISLPFRGFARFGAVRQIDRKRGFIRRTIPRVSGAETVVGIFDRFVSPELRRIQRSGSHCRICLGGDDRLPHSGLGWRSSLNYIVSEKEEVEVTLNDSKVDAVPANPCTSSPCAANVTDGLQSSAWPAEEDILLTHYLLMSSGLPGYVPQQGLRTPPKSETTFEAPFCVSLTEEQLDSRDIVSSLLLLQHLETRLLRVRDKDAKGCLQRQICLAFTFTMQTALASTETRPLSATSPSHAISAACPPLASDAISVHTMLPLARLLLKNYLRLVDELDLNGKQSSRLMTSLFEGMECWQLEKSSIFDRSLLRELLLSEPCLEVLKELQKNCHVLNAETGAATVGIILLALLEKDKEKLVKIVMFMQQQHLFGNVDSDRLESLLVTALRNSPEGSWSAVMAYMTGVGDAEGSDKTRGVSSIREACRRVVRGLLTASEGHSASMSEAMRTESRTLDLSIARRLLCRYEISDDVEFQALFATIRNLDVISTSNDGTLIGSDSVTFNAGDIEYMPSFYSASNIIWVDGSDLDVLSHASYVLTQGSGGAVGIDVEWRPFSTGMPPSPCSLLQIGCRSHCFLFDLLTLERLSATVDTDFEAAEGTDCLLQGLSLTEHAANGSVGKNFSNLLLRLFRDPCILKIGFGLSGDFKRLQSSYPASAHYDFSLLQSAVDIATSPLSQGRGLSAVCCALLGKPLDKRFQLSDWQKRPLSDDQIHYAAADAGILIAIHDAITMTAFPP